MGRRKEFRTIEWLESFTGYSGEYAREVLRLSGLDWRTATESQIRHAINRNVNRARAVMTRKSAPIEHDGRRWTVDEFAALVGATPRAIRARRARFGEWARVVERSLAVRGKWSAGHALVGSKGRPPMRITIDGETRLRAEWLAVAEMTKQGLWKAARKHGRTTTEELIERVRARRSDAAPAPASVASVQTSRMVRGDQRVSACAASGRGANNNEQRGAA